METEGRKWAENVCLQAVEISFDHSVDVSIQVCSRTLKFTLRTMVVFWNVTHEWTYRYTPTFRRNMLFPYSGMKVEAVCSYSNLVSTSRSTWCYNSKNQHLYFHSREKLKSHFSYVVLTHNLIDKNAFLQTLCLDMQYTRITLCFGLRTPYLFCWRNFRCIWSYRVIN
jgi:hypothetical protein